ncbi:8361_t:CDS:1, partial [Gigaspora margarita]
MGAIDGTRFPISYLLIAAGKKLKYYSYFNSMDACLKNKQLTNFSHIFMDKDLCEINAAQNVWPDVTYVPGT